MSHSANKASASKQASDIESHDSPYPIVVGPTIYEPNPRTTGLRSRPVAFVRAGAIPATIEQPAEKSTDGDRIANSYLALFEKSDDSKKDCENQKKADEDIKKERETLKKEEEEEEGDGDGDPSQGITTYEMCSTCAVPLTPAHRASFTHQFRTPVPILPSTIDRTRLGLSVLQSHGWDPDARVGLGARGQGILDPIIAEERGDKRGIGAEAINSSAGVAGKSKAYRVEKKTLHAGAVRKQEKRKVERAQKLEREIFGREGLGKYLDPRDEWE